MVRMRQKINLRSHKSPITLVTHDFAAFVFKIFCKAYKTPSESPWRSYNNINMNLKYGGRMWTVIIWFRSGTGGGVFELDNKT